MLIKCLNTVLYRVFQGWLNIDDFTIVKSNNDIGKLWEQRVPFSNKLI